MAEKKTSKSPTEQPQPPATPATQLVQPPDEPVAKTTISFELTPEEIYMIVGGLGCLVLELRKSHFDCFKNRAWKYEQLAHRLDKEYIPLLDSIDTANEVRIARQARRAEAPGEAQ